MSATSPVLLALLLTSCGGNGSATPSPAGAPRATASLGAAGGSSAERALANQAVAAYVSAINQGDGLSSWNLLCKDAQAEAIRREKRDVYLDSIDDGATPEEAISEAESIDGRQLFIDYNSQGGSDARVVVGDELSTAQIQQGRFSDDQQIFFAGFIFDENDREVILLAPNADGTTYCLESDKRLRAVIGDDDERAFLPVGARITLQEAEAAVRGTADDPVADQASCRLDGTYYTCTASGLVTPGGSDRYTVDFEGNVDDGSPQPDMRNPNYTPGPYD